MMNLICPRDQSTLVAQGTSVPTIYLCENCRGLWFPTAAVAAVIGQPPKVAATAAQKESAQAAVVCPEDGKPLARFLVDGVELDICPACEGVWFDRGEVEYIRAKKAGTAPVVSASDSGVSQALAGAVGDATEKLRGFDVAPDVIVLTTEIGARAIGTALANPELVGQVAHAVGDMAGSVAPVVVASAADLAGTVAPLLAESAANLAPDIAGAIVDLIVGAFTN